MTKICVITAPNHLGLDSLDCFPPAGSKAEEK